MVPLCNNLLVRRTAPLLVLLILAGDSGCVRRRMTIRSNPPGAVAFVDDRRIGVTPVSTPFTYYGTRKIQLFKEGFESQTVKQKFAPPWYEYPVLDFISENLWPQEIRDERVVEVDLQPQQIIAPQELVGRAEMLRGSTQQGSLIGLPAGASTPAVTPAPTVPLTPASFQNEGEAPSLIRLPDTDS